jgi:hypothetical protein
MHDIHYDRSEIIFRTVDHQLLEENDYDDNGKRLASYHFSDYLQDKTGFAPGKISARVFSEKNGKDNTLDMTAAFIFLRPGLWLMKECKSQFRDHSGASTAWVTPLSPNAEHLKPMAEVLDRLKATRDFFAQFRASTQGELTVPFQPGPLTAPWLRATWAKEAGKRKGDPLIAVQPVQLRKASDGTVVVKLKIVSTAYHRKYAVRIDADLLGRDGKVATATATPIVTAMKTPSLEDIELRFPPNKDKDKPAAEIRQITLKATVTRLVGIFHGSAWLMSMSGK